MDSLDEKLDEIYSEADDSEDTRMTLEEITRIFCNISPEVKSDFLKNISEDTTPCDKDEEDKKCQKECQGKKNDDYKKTDAYQDCYEKCIDKAEQERVKTSKCKTNKTVKELLKTKLTSLKLDFGLEDNTIDKSNIYCNKLISPPKSAKLTKSITKKDIALLYTHLSKYNSLNINFDNLIKIINILKSGKFDYSEAEFDDILEIVIKNIENIITAQQKELKVKSSELVRINKLMSYLVKNTSNKEIKDDYNKEKKKEKISEANMRRRAGNFQVAKSKTDPEKVIPKKRKNVLRKRKKIKSIKLLKLIDKLDYVTDITKLLAKVPKYLNKIRFITKIPSPAKIVVQIVLEILGSFVKDYTLERLEEFFAEQLADIEEAKEGMIELLENNVLLEEYEEFINENADVLEIATNSYNYAKDGLEQ